MLIEQRNSLKGEVTIPGDKSISQRAILFGALAKGTTEIDNFLLGEDCMSTIDCFRKMQVGIEILPGSKLRVQGKGLYGLKAPSSILNTGKSGTAIRLILGVLCAQPFSSTVIRDESAMKKPVGKVVYQLKQMGAIIAGKEDGNLCPLTISSSNLRGITCELSQLDTQIKSPILIAGLYASGETTISESVKSRDHSELMLNCFGAEIRIDGLRVTSHMVENLYAQHIEVPGDISIAAYYLTAGLLVPSSDITIKNVGINPTRTGILDVYRQMGAKIDVSNERTANNERIGDIHVVSSGLSAINIDGSLIPSLIDELPVITVAAAFAKGTTRINGLSSFKVKESNKLKSIVMELTKMGARVQETENSLVIEGGRPLKGTVVESHGNSSLAMSLYVAGLAAEGETMIRKTQAVDIAFPDYFQAFNRL